MQRQQDNDIDAAFRQQAEDWLSRTYTGSDIPVVGAETEYSVIEADTLTPASAEQRDAAISGLPFADSELGAAMAETRTDPLELAEHATLDTFARELRNQEEELADAMAQEGLSLIRYGTNPFNGLDEIELSQEDGVKAHEDDRYDILVNRFAEIAEPADEPFGFEGTISRDIPRIAATICSIQLNIQADGMEDAVEKANYLNMTLPYAVAVSGNASILDGMETGIPDIRLPLWEENYNTSIEPYKVGPLDPDKGYYKDIVDYVERMSLFYEEADNPFQAAIGETWKDVKIKFLDGDSEATTSDPCCVVEARPVSTQPSVEEDVAVYGFMLGRLAYAQETGESLMDLEYVHQNREQAMLYGLDGSLYVHSDGGQELEELDARDAVRYEIDRAEQGLDNLNITDPGYLDMLRQRTERFDTTYADTPADTSYGTPAERTSELYQEARKEYDNLEDALASAITVVGAEQ